MTIPSPTTKQTWSADELEVLEAWRPLDEALASSGLTEKFFRRMLEVGAPSTLDSRPGVGLVVQGEPLFAVESVLPQAVKTHRAVKSARSGLEKAMRGVADAHDMVRIVEAKTEAAKTAAVSDGQEKSAAVAQRLAGEHAAVAMGVEIAAERVAAAMVKVGEAIEKAAADVEAEIQERCTKAGRGWARSLKNAEAQYREWAVAAHELRRLGVFAPHTGIIPAGDFVTVLERNRDGHVDRLAAEAGVR
jgi:hypothetical protein